MNKRRSMHQVYAEWGLDVYSYDPADDGPEVIICDFFAMFPEGASHMRVVDFEKAIPKV